MVVRAYSRSHWRWMPVARLLSVMAVLAIGCLTACQDGFVIPAAGSCAPASGESISFGYYAFFEPVSYSEDPDPASAGFSNHMGYEADLLTALEAMEEGRLVFERRPVAVWNGIWLLPATAEFDVVGGGITILDSRTRDAAGNKTVEFTSGHIAFRQSLLARSEDADSLSSYDNLSSDVRIGVLRGTTGEARLLEITGITGEDGALALGTRVETPEGAVVADGTGEFSITAAHASPALESRIRIFPSSPDMPQVIYLGDETGEEELLAALRDGAIDAVARGEIGNGEVARAGEFEVAAVDTQAEYGGFALAAEDTELLACIDRKLDWLTDERRIGYAEWAEDPGVFLTRADLWSGETE